MRFLVFFVLAVPLLAGCGKGGPFDYIPVSGTVTYEDGTLIPASRIELAFTSLAPPIGKKVVPRIGYASVKVSDGTFSGVTSYKFSDGLVPGKHKVTFVVDNPKGKRSDLMAAKYFDVGTTPLIVDTADIPLQIKVPKP